MGTTPSWSRRQRRPGLSGRCRTPRPRHWLCPWGRSSACAWASSPWSSSARCARTGSSARARSSTRPSTSSTAASPPRAGGGPSALPSASTTRPRVTVFSSQRTDRWQRLARTTASWETSWCQIAARSIGRSWSPPAPMLMSGSLGKSASTCSGTWAAAGASPSGASAATRSGRSAHTSSTADASLGGIAWGCSWTCRPVLSAST
mmetsp:Transcript_71578/g.232714  ORF Transcript_71578/g.232714 Transcript_71578/m.232714 type:complete len:205 (-) Transcript_71578:232-846(-)